MAKAISWVAVNKSGEVCLDSDPSPLPRGWERCLDLQSGVMYLKQMSTSSHSDNQGSKKGTTHKRKRFLFEDDNGAGDPMLQLSLSMPACSFDGGDSARRASLSQMQPGISPMSTSRGKNVAVTGDNDSATSKLPCASKPRSLIMDGVLSLPQATQSKESGSRRDAATSSNRSSPSHNASSSSSSSSLGSPSKGLRANQWGLGGVNEVIKARGCPHCFMYVLPSRNNPKCPRCKSHILVDLSPLSTH